MEQTWLVTGMHEISQKAQNIDMPYFVSCTYSLFLTPFSTMEMSYFNMGRW